VIILSAGIKANLAQGRRSFPNTTETLPDHLVIGSTIRHYRFWQATPPFFEAPLELRRHCFFRLQSKRDSLDLAIEGPVHRLKDG
jgi:hypothetical protein